LAVAPGQLFEQLPSHQPATQKTTHRHCLNNFCISTETLRSPISSRTFILSVFSNFAHKSDLYFHCFCACYNFKTTIYIIYNSQFIITFWHPQNQNFQQEYLFLFATTSVVIAFTLADALKFPMPIYPKMEDLYFKTTLRASAKPKSNQKFPICK
jgi:hypothetical protein